MLKFKVSYVIKGAIHRPAYDGTTEVWANRRSEVSQSLYRKLKSGPFFEISPGDVKIESIEYLTLVD